MVIKTQTPWHYLDEMPNESVDRIFTEVVAPCNPTYSRSLNRVLKVDGIAMFWCDGHRELSIALTQYTICLRRLQVVVLPRSKITRNPKECFHEAFHYVVVCEPEFSRGGEWFIDQPSGINYEGRIENAYLKLFHHFKGKPNEKAPLMIDPSITSTRGAWAAKVIGFDYEGATISVQIKTEVESILKNTNDHVKYMQELFKW